MTETMVDIKNAWIRGRFGMADAMLGGAGFSFSYDGTACGPELLDRTRVVDCERADDGWRETVEIDSTGIEITRTAHLLDYAVEYRLTFRNSGKTRGSAISCLHALDMSFALSGEDVHVLAAGGGMADSCLPPRTFALRKVHFAPTSLEASAIEVGTEGGRSSNKDMPYFFLHNDVLNEGMFVAIGWAGQWDAMILRDPLAKTLNVRARIPDVEIALEPGEALEGPSIMVGFYQGTVADGANRLRRVIRDAYTPKLAGADVLPVATYDTWFGVNLAFDERRLCDLADHAAAIGQEYFLLDAGWFAGAEGAINFNPGVGNWYQIDRAKLPNGLETVAQYVRAKGLKFGLWFEPERVAKGSQLEKEHPDWVLWRAKEPETWWQAHYPELYAIPSGLLDYGRPEVQQWVREMMDHYIRTCDVKYVRYDFNIDPLAYWAEHDEPNRRGIHQLRHIAGFNSVIDWIRERHPDVLLESCASGGRRLDLETLRRFHTALISDHTADPAIIRFHLFGINHFLPGNYHYVLYTTEPGEREDDPISSDLGFQSLFAGAFGVGGQLDQWPEWMKQRMRLHVDAWKQVRRYLVEDYYPLGRQPADMTSWTGWQFHDPKDQSGFVQTFRTNTRESTHRFVVHALEAGALYRFTDVYDATSFEVTGSAATREGMEFSQAPMSARVFVYRKVVQSVGRPN